MLFLSLMHDKRFRYSPVHDFYPFTLCARKSRPLTLAVVRWRRDERLRAMEALVKPYLLLGEMVNILTRFDVHGVQATAATYLAHRHIPLRAQPRSLGCPTLSRLWKKRPGADHSEKALIIAFRVRHLAKLGVGTVLESIHRLNDGHILALNIRTLKA
jgi:hypothetical protein